jgi:hypothetical protein
MYYIVSDLDSVNPSLGVTLGYYNSGTQRTGTLTLRWVEKGDGKRD